MTEGKKIGIACAIGGAIGTAVALIVAAPFWWLGLLAGFSGGYVSYEFRAVLRAIPQVWRVFIDDLGYIGRQTVIFFKNPILHFMLLSVGIFALGLLLTIAYPAKIIFSKPGWLQVTWGFSLIFFFVAQIIAVEEVERQKRRLSDLSYKEVAIGWGKCAGVWLASWVTLLTLPVWLPIVTCYFLYKLIRIIHSDKRLLCGVDAAIGTGVAYVTLARPEMTLAQYALVIAAGTMVGAALGVVNYEVVSKRILHLNGAEARNT